MRLFTILVLSTATSALAQTPTQPPAPLASSSQPDAGLGPAAATIGIDDTVNINVLHCPEISRAWRVGASGNLQLPVIGVVRAAGRTIEELEIELVRRLDRYLKAPSVTVTIADRRSAPVTFTGAVERPGTLQLQEHRKLFEAVMLAGGFKPTAAALTLTRRAEVGEIPLSSARVTDDGRFWVARIPVGEVQSSRGVAANVELKPNDVVDVQLQPPRLVHIIGEVAKPGSIELTEHSSVPLTKALAVVGGTTRLASMGKVMLRKVNETGGTTEIAVVDVKKIYKGKALDLDLTEGYVVVVPSNEVKAYVQTASLAAVNSGVFAGLQVLARY